MIYLIMVFLTIHKLKRITKKNYEVVKKKIQSQEY